jgi:hypothetical protein
LVVFQVFVIEIPKRPKDDNGKTEIKYIDASGRVYADFEDFLNTNQLAKAAMLYPQKGNYFSQDADKPVTLVVDETRSTQLLPRVLKIVETVVTVAGVTLSVAGVVTYFRPDLLSKTVSMVMQAGSYFLNGYSIYRYDNTDILTRSGYSLNKPISLNLDYVTLLSTSISTMNRF